MSAISETIISYLPPQKTTPTGWRKFNAVCCHYRGERPDTKGRGGVIESGDLITYHCFNCKYTASWQPGRLLSHKIKTLLMWLHVPNGSINKLALHALRENEGVTVDTEIALLPKFEEVDLPEKTLSISDVTNITPAYLSVVEYMAKRDLYLDDYNFCWSEKLGMRNRLIIPFYDNNKIVGWTGRIVGPGSPRYLSNQQVGYVFNLDAQQDYTRPFVIACEGVVDAILMQGVGFLGSEIKDQQAMLINRLNKQVILVPDRDRSGKALVEPAIKLGWSVSLPAWEDDIRDIGEAVERYGRLYTLYSIVNGALSSPLKIRLGVKKWFDTINPQLYNNENKYKTIEDMKKDLKR